MQTIKFRRINVSNLPAVINAVNWNSHLYQFRYDLRMSSVACMVQRGKAVPVS